MSTVAWLVSAIFFGVEVYGAVVNVADQALANAFEGVAGKLLNLLSGAGERDEIAALRACAKGIGDLSDAPVTESTALSVLKFGWQCVPEMMKVWLKGAAGWAAAVVIAAVATAVGLILTALNLIVTGAREVFDELVSFNGKSDPFYDITVTDAGVPITQASLLSAPVPSLCGHRPGRLVDGKLPGIPSRDGTVQLSWIVQSNRAPQAMFATGDLTGDGLPDAAVVFYCNRGGVGWPHWIVFYGAGLQVLGAFETGAVVGDARSGTTRITYSDGRIAVESFDSRLGDSGCCPSGRATYSLRWNGSKIVAEDIKHLVGPNDVTFSSVGSVRLGMNRSQLEGLGYTGIAGTNGCLYYSSRYKPPVTYDPTRDAVVAISAPSDRYQTHIGGIRMGGSLLATLQRAHSRAIVSNCDFTMISVKAVMEYSSMVRGA